MRTDRLELLADTVERLAGEDYWRDGNPVHGHDHEEHYESFTTQSETYPCGAPACLAGWTNHLAGNPDAGLDEAREWLEIEDKETAMELFMPDSIWHASAQEGDDEYISPQRAADTLRRFAQTGEVIWDAHYV